jgi:hypothetical protein
LNPKFQTPELVAAHDVASRGARASRRSSTGETHERSTRGFIPLYVSRDDLSIVAPQPTSLTQYTCCGALGISARKFLEAARAKKFPSRKDGHDVIARYDDVERYWLGSLAEGNETSKTVVDDASSCDTPSSVDDAADAVRARLGLVSSKRRAVR